MNYEEKYNNAIESIKRIYDQADSYGKELMEKEFPELRESEDERIRKEILYAIRQLDDKTTIYGINYDYKKWIAWLEKQGEQGIIDLKEYAKGILKGAAIHLMLWIDENLADGKMCLSNMECEDLEDAMVNAKWDKIYKYIKKKVEKQDEHKPSWSKEDEHRLKDTIYFLETAKAHYASMVELDACIAWLKSLKPNHWKPSEEQMQALFEAKLASTKNREYFLGLLYEDLKKL